MAQIAGEPDKPTKPLASIVELFPESSERTRVARIPELQKAARGWRNRQPNRRRR